MRKSVELCIIGKGPMLTHNPASMQSTEKKSKKGMLKSGASNIPTPEIEAEKGLYIDGDGDYCVPGIAIRNAMLKAAAKFSAPFQKKKENLRQVMGHCIVGPELLKILSQKTNKPLREYEIDRRRAVIQRQGIIRCRPRFDGWKVKFELIYDDMILRSDEETVRVMFEEVLGYAGNIVGIMDYRPEKGGWFGLFEVPQE
jgi:hypothetical protein